jgi:AcrR family transcriptional regulator
MAPPRAPADAVSPRPDSPNAVARAATSPKPPRVATPVRNGTAGSTALGGAQPASKRVLRSQGQRTMRRLLDAALIAFGERGYYDTRVNDVVKIAKTSHGTFYLYFSNKEDLLRALVAEAGTSAQYLADTLNRPPERGDRPQWQDVRGWVSAYSELWTRHAALFRAWTDLARIDPALTAVLQNTFAVMTDALARQITPASTPLTVDAQTAATAALAMLDRFHDVREFMHQPVDGADLDTLTTMIYRALFATDPSIAPALTNQP